MKVHQDVRFHRDIIISLFRMLQGTKNNKQNKFLLNFGGPHFDRLGRLDLLIKQLQKTNFELKNSRQRHQLYLDGGKC